MMNCVEVAILKPKSVVQYTDFGSRRYNDKSRDNLKQNTTEKLDKNGLSSKLVQISKNRNVKCVNTWARQYQNLYYQETQKSYLGTVSSAVAAKIYKITSVFINSVIKMYQPSSGFKQRLITFSTFTLSEPQKHSDKEIIKTFVDFIDHLKKVDNHILGTFDKAPGLKNYVWRAETQENGNIHFHLIADCYLNKNTLQRLWNKYLLKLGYAPSNNSAFVESLKKDKKNNKILDVENYLVKYMTKAPLKNEYKGLTQSQALALYETTRGTDNEVNPFRRPVIGKIWGCSKALRKVDFPKFYDTEIAELDELKKELTEKKLETLPDFIRYYSGNVKKALKKCRYELQRKVKNYYKNVFMLINSSKTMRLTRVMMIRIDEWCRANKLAHGCRNEHDYLEMWDILNQVNWSKEILMSNEHQSLPPGPVVNKVKYVQTSLFD